MLNRFNRTIIKIKLLKNWHKFILPAFIRSYAGSVTVKLRNGLKIALRNGSTDLMILYHIFSIREYDIFGNFDKNKEYKILDIGGHVGMYALWVAQELPHVQIYVYEPDLDNISLLKQNVRSNNLTERIKVIQAAVCGQTGKRLLYINPINSSMNNVYEPREDRGGSKMIEVNSITLEQIINGNKVEKFDFAKIDCEGAEYEILMSAPDDVLTKLPYIVIEWHTYNSHRPEELIQFLKDKGYTTTYSRKPRIITARRDKM